MAEPIAGMHVAATARKLPDVTTITRDGRRWLKRTVKAFRASLNPHTKLEVQLVNAQLKMLRGATWPFVFILPPASILIAWANVPWVPIPVLVAWCAAVSLSCIAFDVTYRRVEAATGNDAAGVSTRAKAFTIMGTMQAALWSTMGIVMWAPDQPVNHMLLILILASSFSGWSAIGSFHLASGRAPLLCYAAVMIFSPLLSPDALDHAIAGMCLAFACAMMVYASKTYQTTRRMLCLQFERTGLIANLKRAKRESDSARKRAESASVAKSQFLANMSHELRTPMNAILGFSELISTKSFGGAVDKYAEYATLIHNSGKHLLALINDILDLAKIEAGRFELNEEDVDFAALVLDAVRTMAGKAERNQLHLQTQINGDLPLLHADERALRQILINLLSNAVKFTPSGGRVTIFARAADDEFVFGVDDNGVGIEEDDLERVFESFGQGRHDITTFEKGTGLGLPIVKGLTEAHGGRVELRSRKNEGTRVAVCLPGERLVARPRTRLIGTGIPSVGRGGGWGA